METIGYRYRRKTNLPSFSQITQRISHKKTVRRLNPVFPEDEAELLRLVLVSDESQNISE